MLDSVLRSLDAAVAATDERARVCQLEPASAGASLVDSAPWQERMRSIDLHLAAVDNAVARADECCRAVEAELEMQEAQIKRWQAVTQKSSRRLAKATPRSL
jgi:hypothetical protein